MDKEIEKTLEVIKNPVKRIKTITRTQGDILEVLTRSTKLQYDSFESKYVAFNQIFINIKGLYEDQNDKLLKIYTSMSTNIQNLLAKQEEAQILETIEEKNDSNSLLEIKKRANKGEKKQNPIRLEQKKETGNTLKRNQALRASRVGQVTIKKHMKDQSESVVESNDDHEQEFDQKDEKQRNSHKGNGNKSGVVSRLLFFKGPNRYQQTRKVIEQKIMNKKKLPNQFNKIGQLLLLPYSTIQMILDYNQSPDYPLYK